LTTPEAADARHAERGNRFQREAWKWIPIPLPRYFVQGMDQQTYDVDSFTWESYLRGEMRKGKGWWYYYLYAFLVKNPIGTLALFPLALSFWLIRSRRGPLVDFAALVLPMAVFVVVLSLNTTLNVHARYMIVIYPYLFVFLAPLAQPIAGRASKLKQWAVALALTANVASVLAVHPFYLTYFNELAGGPRNGYKHLIDSNIDWGQGLVALRQWLSDQAVKGEIQLAYFGAVEPGVYGIKFSLPGTFTESPLGYPRPGLHIISVNYCAGSSYSPLDPHGRPQALPEQAYRFYQQLAPVATIANCLHVYEVSAAQIEQLRVPAGAPPEVLNRTDTKN
jgi:hypothetical protein